MTGSGFLAEIVFRVVGSEGQSSVIDLTNVVLGDNTASAIPSFPLGATVNVGTPIPTPTATLVPTATSVGQPAATATRRPRATATNGPASVPANTPTPLPVSPTSTPTPTPTATPTAAPGLVDGAIERQVSPEESARIVTPDQKASIDIPSGALDEPAVVSVRPRTAEEVPPPPRGLRFSGAVVEVSFEDADGNPLEGLRLRRTATVSFTFTFQEFLDAGEGGLVTHRLASGGTEWTPLATDVSLADKVASARTSTFSSFALTTTAPAPSPTPTPTPEPTTAPVATVAPMATPVAPSPGGTAPSPGLLLAFVVVGLMLSAAGVYYLARAR